MAGTEILIGLAISAATSAITSALAPKQRLLPVDKGRFDDIRIQGSEYGSSIPIVYGRARLAGNVIWSDGVQPWVTTTPGRSGGKMGGGHPPEPPTNNYSYTTNIAIAICEGPVNAGLKRMWENTKVTINNDTSPLSGQTWEAESSINTFTGGASIVRDLSASSGYKVQFIGTSTLVLNNLNIPQAGAYNIKISYATAGDKSALMKVDAGTNQVVNFPSTGSSSIFVSVSIPFTFTQGVHTITFSNNGSNIAPYFDAISINGAGVLVTPTQVTGIVNTDATYPSDLSDPSAYYNARLTMDSFGTSEGRVNELTVIPTEPIDPTHPPDDGDGGPIIYPGGGSGTGTNTGSASFRFYAGTETQLQDPMMLQIDGAAKVPAYRGTSYISFTQYQIADGQMPNFTFEVDEGTHDLADIVTSLWKRVGLDDTQLDVASLIGTYVEGLVIVSRTPVGDILDILQVAFAFDFVDINGKITAVKRGQASIVTLLPDDLRAYEDGGEVPVAELEGTYVNVEELPRQIDVSYLDRVNDYHTNVQSALMQIGFTEEPQTLTLPLVLNADAAHEIGMRVLNTVHLQRVTYAFTLPPKFSYLSPADVITIQMPNVTHKLRISQFQSGMPGLCKVQAVPDSSSLYQQVAAGDAGAGTENAPIQFPANTELVLMDIPPLMPEHTGFGFYAAACGRGTGSWYGAHLYREEVPDSGNYERIGGFEVPATIGTVTNSLSTSPTYTDIGGGQLVDTTSSVVVQLFDGVLESFPQANLFSNPALNLCYIGGELVQFATASALSSAVNPYIRQYTLTNFRRGVNGTNAKIAIHGTGEQFVYINNAVQRMREQSALLYINSRYKAVSIGQPLAGAAVTTFNTGSGSTPPVATNLVLVQRQLTTPEGVSQIAIRGTFKFGVYTGGQRAKIFVRRPTLSNGGPSDIESTYFNTGIIVTPDASNNGAFEFPAATNGYYVFQVVTMSPYDHQALSGHPSSTIQISADNPVPATPSTPVPTFDGQMVNWTWTQSTDPRHAYYQFADGSNIIVAGGNRVDGNSFTEYPINGAQRTVRAVSNQGTPSLWSPAGTFTLPTPSVPTSYQLLWDGSQIVHNWSSNPAYSYEISNAALTVIGSSRTGQWIETTTPAGRSITRNVRSVQYGASSAWVSQTLTIAAPPPPDAVTFDSANATPFDIPVTITKPATLDRRLIKRTVVEVINNATSTVLYTMPFEGVAESCLVSGRSLNSSSRVIKVRASYEDVIGAGTTAITAGTYTFTMIGNSDLPDNVIDHRTLSDGSVLAGTIANGVLNIAHFGSTIQPVLLYSGTTLPTLPNGTYPPSTVIYWTDAPTTTDRVLWVNRNNVWVKSAGATSFAELTGTIAAGQIASGTITDAMISAASNFSRITTTQIQSVITGGGTLAWNNSNQFSWTSRLISLPNALASNGFIEFGPTDGTTMGTGVNFVTLTAWQAIMFRFPIGGANSAANAGGNIAYNTAAGGWFVIDYTTYTSAFTVPAGYKDFLIAVHNGDNHNLYLWDGRVIQQGSQIDGGMAVSQNSISTLQLQAASITAAKIAAGAITADKIAVGLQTGNLAVNPSFENLYTVITGDYYATNGVSVGTIVPEGWNVLNNNGTAVTAASQSIAAADGAYVLKLVANGTNKVTSKAMPVSAGSTYLIRARAYGTSTGFYMTAIEGTSVNANGYTVQSTTTAIETNVTTSTSWTEYGTPRTSPFYYTVPAGVTYLSLEFKLTGTGTVYVDDVVATKQFGTTYIQNGAITTDLISAGAIRAQNIQVGTFSESMQMNSRFIDSGAGYYDTVSSGSLGTAITIPASPTTATYSTGTDASIPSEWTGVTAVTYLQLPTTNPTIYGNWIPLNLNDTYYVSVWVRTLSGTSTVSAGIYTDAGNFTGRVFASQSIGTTWTKLEGVVGKTGTGANYKAWTDTTLGTSNKFRIYITSTGGVNVRFAEVMISRMQTGNLIVNGAITATQINTSSISTAILTANSIQAGMIAAAAVSADQIAAGSIRADKLAVGTISENKILNPSFENFDATATTPIGWANTETNAGAAAWISATLATDIPSVTGGDGAYALRMSGSGSNFDVGSQVVPVTEGQRLVIRFKAYSAAASGTYSVFIAEYNAAMPTGKLFLGATTSGTIQTRTSFTGLTNTLSGASESLTPASPANLTTLNGSTFKQKECSYTVPAGVKYIALIFRATSPASPLYIDALDVRAEITGVVIQDGTLTATKIVAGSITGIQIAAGSITADKLTVQTVGDNILSNPSFENYDASNIPVSWKIVFGSSSTFVSSTDYATDGARSLRIDGTATACDIGSLAIPVTAGDKYYFSFKARSESAVGTYTAFIFEYSGDMPSGKYYVGSSTANTQAVDYTSLGTPVNTSGGANESLSGVALTSLNGGWKTKECVYIPATGVKWVTISFRAASGTLYVDAARLNKFITGVQIEDDTITAGKIKAGSITADKIAIGAFGNNIVTNPSFEDFDSTTSIPTAWKIGEGSGTFSSSTTQQAEGNRSLKIDAGNIGISSVAFPVTEGANYTVRFKIRSTATTGLYYARMQELNTSLSTSARYIGSATSGDVIARSSLTDLTNTYAGANESMSGSSVTNINAGGWIQKEATYTIPTGVRFVSLGFFNWGANASIFVDDVVVQKKVSGVFIENGTITAENLVIGGMSDDLVANGSFEILRSVIANNGSSYVLPESWYFYNTVGSVTSYSIPSSSAKAIQVSSGGASSRVIPVSPGSKISIRFQTWASSGTPTATMNVRYKATMPSTGTDLQKNYIGTTAEGSSAADSTTTYSAVINTTPTYYETVMTVPAGMYWMSINPSSAVSYIYYDDVTVRKQVGQAFISDLRADQIVANTGDIGLIFSDQIKQRSYVPYQGGSTYTPDDQWNYTNASAVTYDDVNDELKWTGSTFWDTTGTVYSQTYQKINAYAYVNDTLTAVGTNGYFEFTLTEANSAFAIQGGISGNINPASYSNGAKHSIMDYGFYISGLNVYCTESGNNNFLTGHTPIAGDVYRTAIEDGYARFRINGNLVWTSPRKPYVTSIRGTGTVPANSDYRGVILFGSLSGTPTIRVRSVKLGQDGYGQGWRLNPLTGTQVYAQEPIWINGVGNLPDLYTSAGKFIKNGGTTAWDTSATTEQTIAAGDGWIQATTFDNNSTGVMIGLANSNFTNPNYTTLNFAIFRLGQTLYVYENGTQVFDGGSAPVTAAFPGETFRVAIESGRVKYRWNGSVFYVSSATLPSSPYAAPYKGKVCLFGPNEGVSNVLFTASSAGSGEFNSGLTIRGQRLEDIVRASTVAVRYDNRYRGNDTYAPANQINTLKYDTYFTSFEDDIAFATISVVIDDYKTNNTKNLDSSRAARVRVYNKFGTVIKTVYAPWVGKGVLFSGFIDRAYADLKQDAVFSVELENLYGYSQPIWYSEAAWKASTSPAWVGVANLPNVSYTQPTWLAVNDCPTNCQATSLASDSVQVTWSNAANYNASNHDVYYRPFKKSGYEGNVSNEGWTAVSGSVATGTKIITGLASNTRYEFSVMVTGHTYTRSNIAYCRTFAVVPPPATYSAPSGLSGSNATAGQIALTWTTNNAANYTKTEIWYLAGTGIPDASTGTQLGTGFTGTPTGSTTHTGLSAGTTYSYRARNNYNSGANYSDWSNTITVTTQASTPATLPTNVSFVGTGYYTGRVNWTANGGATSHYVQVDYDYADFSSPIYSSGLLADSTNKPRTITGLSSDTTYKTRVSSDGTNWSIEAYGNTWVYTDRDPHCVLDTSNIWIMTPDGQEVEVIATSVKIGDRVLAADLTNGKTYPSAVKEIITGTNEVLYTITTDSGYKLSCSDSHKIITTWSDTKGTAAKLLKTGNTVLIYDTINKCVREDIISDIQVEEGLFNVITYHLESVDHTYIADGIVSHNVKIETF